MLSHGVKRLSLPKIGCGLDKLEWCIEGGKLDVRTILLDVFRETGVVLTVYELGCPQKPMASAGREVSERNAQMRKYADRRPRSQAQGLAADAHRSMQHAEQDRAGTGLASRRAEQKARRQESREELLRCIEPGPASSWDGDDVQLQTPSDATEFLQQCEQCAAFAATGRLDFTTNQWFCGACWDSYEAENGGTSGANSAKAAISAGQDEPDDVWAEKRAAALQTLGGRSMRRQVNQRIWLSIAFLGFVDSRAFVTSLGQLCRT